MIARKEGIVKKLTGGIKMLFKANGVTGIHGHGKVLANKVVEITPVAGGETQEVTADHIIIASGSVPIAIPNVEYDDEYIIDNAGALDINSTPETLGVIGAGVIGLELGSVWRRLGAKVTLLEAMDDFLAAADKDIAKAAQREFKKQKLDIKLGAMVKKAEVVDGKVNVTYAQGDKTHEATFDRLLVAVGRKPCTTNLLSEDCGVELTERGQIKVDDDCRTSVDGIWGIGDVVRGPMLAHKGSEEGIAVAERIAGGKPHVNLDVVPWVVYTEPEIAWVGKTEQQLKDDGVDYRVGSFPYAATGRALAMGESAGMVKMLADAETDRLLGVHIVGANASELIAECVVTMEFHGASEDLARIVHAHPTLSEAVHEAALSVDGRSIHKVN